MKYEVIELTSRSTISMGLVVHLEAKIVRTNAVKEKSSSPIESKK